MSEWIIQGVVGRSFRKTMLLYLAGIVFLAPVAAIVSFFLGERAAFVSTPVFVVILATVGYLLSGRPAKKENLRKSQTIVSSKRNMSCDSSRVKEPPQALPDWKRAIDLLICIIVLPTLAIVTVPWTIVTKLYSPGPVFIRQERTGYSGRRYWTYRFRTVHLVSGSESQSFIHLVPGGWLLRATGLEDLPQLINVLRREMTVVGPRPCTPKEFANYLPWQKQRFAVLPGFVGLWQISGRQRSTVEEMIRLDIRYAENLSFWLDLKILLLTIPSLVIQAWEVRKAKPEESPIYVEVEPNYAQPDAKKRPMRFTHVFHFLESDLNVFSG